ncbi:MAG: hypothetical protein ACE5J9_10630 [Methanosarcinales archaeon]
MTLCIEIIKNIGIIMLYHYISIRISLVPLECRVGTEGSESALEILKKREIYFKFRMVRK